LFALGIAKDAPGSKIMVCTDGQANCGIGDVSSGRTTEITATYEKIGRLAKEHGVNINVLSIRGEDCCLSQLGQIADISSGTVDIVDPLDLSKQVVQIMNKPILGTGVTCKMVLDQNLVFCSTGTNKDVKEFGSVTSDCDLSFGFEPKQQKNEHKGPVYVQAQLSYTRPNGAKITRIFTKKLETTHNSDQMEANLDSGVVGLHAVQASAELAHCGEYNEARAKLISVMRLLQRGMKTKKNQREYVNYVVQAEKLDGFMRQAMVQAELLGQQIGGKDDSAAKNIVQMKQASLQLFQEVA